MRFTTRDLLWLTVVAALAAVIYTNHVHSERMADRWYQAAELDAQRTAKEEEAMRFTIDELKVTNEILRHQMATLEEIVRQTHVSTSPDIENP
ncbi:MAG TPA: hypothetical protein VGI40_25285 [Pirellulaceae bacterium]|jgi:hypothetical protein